jgi:hypothetical protein
MTNLNILKALCIVLPTVATLAFNHVQTAPTTAPVTAEVPAPSWPPIGWPGGLAQAPQAPRVLAAEVPTPSWPPIGWPGGGLAQASHAEQAPAPQLAASDTTSWPPIGWCDGVTVCTTLIV